MNTKVRRPSLEALLREVDTYISAKESHQPPRIGISANRKDGLSCIADTYIQAVINAGGAPVLIPAITDIKMLTAALDGVDGLLMSGGGDINPLYVGEEPIPELQDVDTFRDEYELILLHLATARQLPIMGICRGHQLINVAFGGSIYQDIYAQREAYTLKHSQKMAREQLSHSVTFGQEKRLVNSFHHQAVNRVAPEFKATAEAPDGLNEGMEHIEKPIYSVQWHPECMAAEGDEESINLFRPFIKNASFFKQAKALHQRIVTLDSHTDTPMLFTGEFNIGEKGGGKVNLPFMEEGLIDATFMVAYLPQGKRDDASLTAATAYAIDRLVQIKRQEMMNSSRVEIAFTPEDATHLKDLHKKAIYLGIENGYALGKELSNVRRFRDLGVTYITLCHNGANDICDSARGEQEWNGLSPFGKEVVREMNRLGIMIDVSHAAESTFYDVLKISQHPIIASHSSARALCNHPRNLTDEQLKAIAAQGGVVQLCLYKGFINEKAEEASISDAIRHINHMVQLIGADHVGIGSDFDGDGELIGCRASNELINITVRLLQEGYSENDIQKIWGGNLLRVMAAVQASQNKQ